MRTMGIDIGTTTICATVIDGVTGEVRKVVTLPNDCFLTDGAPFEKKQDAAAIVAKTSALAATMIEKYPPIGGIGVTGQMHGIVYLNAAGTAVSPLTIWQDGRGDEEYRDGQSYAAYLSALTGYKLATGFGAVTHFYNQVNGLVPPSAVTFCTIHDYLAMTLAGRRAPLVHVSDAASFGLFDLQKGAFDAAAIEKAGMSAAFFPAVTREDECIGYAGEKSDIPVFAAVGDNQASFIGSVQDMEHSVLVNVGTGSQISIYMPQYAAASSMETRPCMDDSYLFVGSSLCGGRAYALLEEFFRDVAAMAGAPVQNLYPAMDALSAQYAALAEPLRVDTAFSGTRDDPARRGIIGNVGINNFTPTHFICGVLQGSVDELHEKYAALGEMTGRHTLVGSGNGIRKGKTLREMFSQTFGMTVKIPVHKEEAAFGAALLAQVGAGAHATLADAQKIIRYIED